VTRLLRVELRRLWLRRVTWAACVLALVAVGIGVASQVSSARPPTPAQIAEAERFYADELAWWEEHGEEEVAACEEAAAAEGEDYGCADLGPRLEHFLPSATTFVPDAAERLGAYGAGPDVDDEADPDVVAIQQSIWSGWSGLPSLVTAATGLLMLAFVVGVSFLTAEQGTGSLGMWLTFEPRRQRVYWSKAAAAALGTIPLVVLGWAALVGGAYAVYAFFGTLGDVTSATWGEIALFTGRLTLAGVAFAAIGVALAVLLRHAAAAVGVGAGVLWLSSVFAYSLGEFQRWTPALNFDAWLRGGATYEVVRTTMDDAGVYSEHWVTHVVTGWQGGAYLLALTVALSALALVVFRRHDVS
jgi:ABC-2 type transport system permease protein